MLKNLKKDATASLAKERLNAILASDRLHCSNEQITAMETDVLHTINKYFTVLPSKLKTRILLKDGQEDELLLIFEASVKK